MCLTASSALRKTQHMQHSTFMGHAKMPELGPEHSLDCSKHSGSTSDKLLLTYKILQMSAAGQADVSIPPDHIMHMPVATVVRRTQEATSSMAMGPTMIPKGTVTVAGLTEWTEYHQNKMCTVQ